MSEVGDSKCTSPCKEDTCKENPCEQECKPQEYDGNAYGADFAEYAIREMRSDARKVAEQNIKDKDKEDEAVNGFLEQCEKRGQDPFELVAFIAHKNGVVLSEDAPKDCAKREVYNLLKAVVKKLVVGLIVSIADEHGFGLGSILKIASGVANRRDSERGKVNQNKDLFGIFPAMRVFSATW